VSYNLISSEVRKARKPHRCIWCGQPIVAGEKYRHERSTFNGDFQVQDWHPECDDAFAEVVRYEGGEAEFSPYENDRPKQVTVSRDDIS
jgi:hypothetical protein